MPRSIHRRSADELTCGKGSSGTATPRNSQRGSHPCRTSYTSSLSAGITSSTFREWPLKTAMVRSRSLKSGPKTSDHIWSSIFGSHLRTGTRGRTLSRLRRTR